MKKSFYNPTTLHDLLMNTLVGFILLFTVAFLLIKPVEEKMPKPKAEFLITVTWAKLKTCDVDTWLEDPSGNIAYFKQKDIGLMHLDRDDLGSINDVVTLDSGQVIDLKVNEERTTIRGIIPGEYVLNVHMYSHRNELPVEVHIRIDKLNPTSQTVFTKTVVLKEQWQEITVTRFTVGVDGDILNWNDLPKNLLKRKH